MPITPIEACNNNNRNIKPNADKYLQILQLVSVRNTYVGSEICAHRNRRFNTRKARKALCITVAAHSSFLIFSV